LDAIRDSPRASIIIQQVAGSFILACFNWAVIAGWATYNLPRLQVGGLFAWDFWEGLVIVLVWPIALSLIGSITYPEPILVAPTDINGLTLGIFTVTLWYSINPLNYHPIVTGLLFYGFSLFIAGFYLIGFGRAQNAAASKLLGLQGSERDLRNAVYRVGIAQDDASDLIWARRRALSLAYEEDLDNETACFTGYPDGIELHMAIYRVGTDVGGETRLTVVAVDNDSFGFKQPDELWFRGRLAAITTLSDMQLTELQNQVPPRSVIEHVLAPTRGMLSQFREAWSGAARHVVAVILLTAADYWLWLNKFIIEDTAIQLGFFIALYVVGISVLSRRRRLRG
jgi:hypothetical protein